MVYVIGILLPVQNSTLLGYVTCESSNKSLIKPIINDNYKWQIFHISDAKATTNWSLVRRIFAEKVGASGRKKISIFFSLILAKIGAGAERMVKNKSFKIKTYTNHDKYNLHANLTIYVDCQKSFLYVLKEKITKSYSKFINSDAFGGQNWLFWFEQNRKIRNFYVRGKNIGAVVK